ncbi:general substrate transporter [Schizophyllum amplum]|uniref:General substrate transporter n=1 Tax=Schizophyllum amplum TaxID=97359 RepID=A0A550C9V3_9AGAR|nr:general substrate transporter [Auriculariopsis ampla]
MAVDFPTNRKAILLGIFVAFGGFLFGYDIGVISGCLIMPDFIERFGELQADGTYVLSSERQSIITSLLSAGTFFGALGQAFTADRFGRKHSILIWSTIFTIGTAIQTGTSTSIAQISAGRFIAGLGVGAMSAIVPLYNGETAPKAMRGVLLVMYQLQVIMGIFISYIIDLGTHAIPNSASWRIPVGLQMLWGLILISGMFFLPESPRHLIGTGRSDEARRIVAQMNSTTEDDPLVLDYMEELEFMLLTRNALWKRTINGMMLQFIQQLNGQNFYYYYGDTFFESAGTELSPYVIQCILGGVSVAGTIPALILIERWGRRRSLLVGAVWEAIAALIAGLVGHYVAAGADVPVDQLTTSQKQGGEVMIAMAVLHVLGFSIFWGPVPWVYLGESFPLRVRPKAIALGSATNWLWNFLLSFFSPRIADDIGPLIMLVFFGMLVFGFCYVWLCIPEVKGLTLEEVDQLYRENVKPWRSATWRPTLLDNVHEHDMSEKPGEVRKENMA